MPNGAYTTLGLQKKEIIMRIEHEHITRPEQNWPEKKKDEGLSPTRCYY